MSKTLRLFLFIAIFVALIFYISTSGMADDNLVYGMIGGAAIAIAFLVARSRNRDKDSAN